MIEVIYKDEKRESKENAEILQIPRNIRQIGLIGGNYRIYVEDYVYTFLGRISEKAERENGGLAILLGDSEWADGVTYVFAKGAVMIEGETITAEHIGLNNEVWKQIQEISEKYFQSLSVVGWFLTMPGLTMDVSELMAKMHLKYFSGNEKIFMMMDASEKEEAVFCYENGRFLRLPGFYLYYEKNPMMQEYMVEKKWWDVTDHANEAPDEAVRYFRKIVRKKAEKQEDTGEKNSIFSYAATACLVLAVLMTGASFVRNYQKLQAVESDLETSSVVAANDDFLSVTPVTQQVNKPIVTESPKDTGVSEKNKSIQGDSEKTQDTEITPEKSKEETEQESVVNTEKEIKKDLEIDAETNTGVKTDVETDTGIDTETEQEIVLETAEQKISKTYVIRPGDTLYQISIANYGNLDAVTKICELNDISAEEIIYPGQIIVLP